MQFRKVLNNSKLGGKEYVIKLKEDAQETANII
jgi:hypothetical protein